MDQPTSPTAEQNAKPKRKLRWYQFSLRTLLICVTLFACACSWFTVKMQQANRQKAAVAALENHGYHITYDYEYYSTAQCYDKPIPHPNWIVKLVGKDFLYDVYCVGIPVSLPGFLKCHVPAFTDADMAVFEQLPQLRIIRLRNRYGNPAKITDKGLTHLKKLKYLEELDLTDTQVTDTGTKSLKASLPSLTTCHGSITGSPANPFVWPKEECIHVTLEDIP